MEMDLKKYLDSLPPTTMVEPMLAKVKCVNSSQRLINNFTIKATVTPGSSPWANTVTTR